MIKNTPAFYSWQPPVRWQGFFFLKKLTVAILLTAVGPGDQTQDPEE